MLLGGPFEVKVKNLIKYLICIFFFKIAVHLFMRIKLDGTEFRFIKILLNIQRSQGSLEQKLELHCYCRVLTIC